MKRSRDRFQKLLSDAVTVFCKEEIAYNQSLHVHGNVDICVDNGMIYRVTIDRNYEYSSDGSIVVSEGQLIDDGVEVFEDGFNAPSNHTADNGSFNMRQQPTNTNKQHSVDIQGNTPRHRLITPNKTPDRRMPGLHARTPNSGSRQRSPRVSGAGVHNSPIPTAPRNCTPNPRFPSQNRTPLNKSPAQALSANRKLPFGSSPVGQNPPARCRRPLSDSSGYLPSQHPSQQLNARPRFSSPDARMHSFPANRFPSNRLPSNRFPSNRYPSVRPQNTAVPLRRNPSFDESRLAICMSSQNGEHSQDSQRHLVKSPRNALPRSTSDSAAEVLEIDSDPEDNVDNTYERTDNDQQHLENYTENYELGENNYNHASSYNHFNENADANYEQHIDERRPLIVQVNDAIYLSSDEGSDTSVESEDDGETVILENNTNVENSNTGVLNNTDVPSNADILNNTGILNNVDRPSSTDMMNKAKMLSNTKMPGNTNSLSNADIQNNTHLLNNTDLLNNIEMLNNTGTDMLNDDYDNIFECNADKLLSEINGEDPMFTKYDDKSNCELYGLSNVDVAAGEVSSTNLVLGSTSETSAWIHGANFTSNIDSTEKYSLSCSGYETISEAITSLCSDETKTSADISGISQEQNVSSQTHDNLPKLRRQTLPFMGARRFFDEGGSTAPVDDMKYDSDERLSDPEYLPTEEDVSSDEYKDDDKDEDFTVKTKSSKKLKANDGTPHTSDEDMGEFVCEYEGCGKVFGLKGNLTRHQRSVHGRRFGDMFSATFECHVNGCRKKFATMTALKRHMTSRHGRDAAQVEKGLL